MKGLVVKAFKTVEETSEPEVAEIIGNIPEWLNGCLVRNGPGKYDFPDFQMQHVFDGYMIISKFEVRGGKSGCVSFSSKFLQSESFKKAEVAQKCVISEYNTRSACSDVSKKSVFARMMSSFFPTTTDNSPFICTTDMCKNPIVIGDTGYMYELDMSSLEYNSRHDPIKEFGVDQETKDTWNVGVSIFSGAKWNIIKFPPGCNSSPAKDSMKNAEIVATHPCRNKTSLPWLHSFAMSKHYIVIIDQPSYFNVTKVIGSIFSKSLCPREINTWNPEKKNRFYFVHKETGKFVRTEILSKEAFFYYHMLNCYEENNQLVIDVFGMPNFDLVDEQSIANIRSGHKAKDEHSPRLFRYVLPLSVADLRNCPENVNLVTVKTTATAIRVENKIILEPELMSESPMECSTFNKSYVGKPLQYIWTTGAFSPSSHQHKIFKFDMQTRKLILWEAEEHQFVGEPVFVPNPNGTLEDDGIIVLVVVNYIETEGGKDFVLFLDAKNLDELARAYFETSEIPVALHSVYVTD